MDFRLVVRARLPVLRSKGFAQGFGWEWCWGFAGSITGRANIFEKKSSSHSSWPIQE